VASTGIYLRTGPFLVKVRSRVEAFTSLLQTFYGQSPMVEDHAIADYHVQISRVHGLRRWWHPQVEFLLDSQTPFLPYPLSHAFPLFEWGLNWCIARYAHQFLMLHSAAVERNGRVLLLPAWPGSGKSTLCAALVSRGWRLFSDEFGLVQQEKSQLVPMPRPIPLKNQSISVIREFAPDAELGPDFHGTRKGTVAHLRSPDASVDRTCDRAPAAWIVFPKFTAGASLQLEPIAKPQAFIKLSNNSFNYRLLGEKGFHGVARLVRDCECYILTYSNLDEAIGVMNRLSEA
jgi:HprK-related kinase A